MAQHTPSMKHLQIDKANTTIVAVVAIASFVTIFSLVATKVLVGQMSYQAKVIGQKTTARDTLKQNLTARNQLVTQYLAFENTTTNVIGGSTAGTGDKDGDNAKIVLDALPSKYDYPALATSLEKLVKQNNLTMTNISGTDDEVAQSTDTGAVSPQPVEMPYELTIEGKMSKTSNFFAALQHSIRPMHVQSLTITGNDNKLNTDIKALTYYQPEKTLKIQEETVR